MLEELHHACRAASINAGDLSAALSISSAGMHIVGPQLYGVLYKVSNGAPFVVAGLIAVIVTGAGMRPTPRRAPA